MRVGNAVGRRVEVREPQPGRLRDLLKIMTQKKQLELLLGLSSTAPALPETIAHHFENFLKNKLVILLRSQWTRLLVIDNLLQLFGKGERVELLRQRDAELALDYGAQDLVVLWAD